MALWKIVIAIMIMGYVAGGVAGCRQEPSGERAGQEMASPSTAAPKGASEKAPKKPLKLALDSF